MAVSTESSTFEYAREWLLSSPTLVADALKCLDLATARARIYWQEVWAEPDEAQEPETAPDQPPPFDARPLVLIQPEGEEWDRVGTGTWAGRGTLLISIETTVAAAYVLNHADDSQETKSGKFQARREWCRRLCSTILAELRETTGRGSEDGAPYLNAPHLSVDLWPSDPDPDEMEDFVGFRYRAEWR